MLTLTAGTYDVTFVNEGKAVHSLSFPQLGLSTAHVPSGGTGIVKVTFSATGSYEFICAEPGHAGAGMKGTITIT